MDSFTIPASKVVQGHMIGKGGYGEVYRGTYEGKEVVLKILIGEQDASTKEKLMAELHFLWNARHPDVVMMHGFVDEPKRLAIVLEYAKYGALSSFLQGLRNHPPLSITVRMVQQLTNAMEFLHGGVKVILHRDLKAENILVDAEFNAKLSDFGLSEYRATVQSTSSGLFLDVSRGMDAGSLSHAPPEKLADRTVIPTRRYDIYSYAITLWEILSRRNVHVGDRKAFEDKTISGHRPRVSDLRPDCPPDLKTLMESCWDGERKKRPYFAKIKSDLEDMTSTLKLTVSESDLKILQTMANFKDPCHLTVQVSAEDLPENQVNLVQGKEQAASLELRHKLKAEQKGLENANLMLMQQPESLEQERTEPKELLQKRDKEDAMQKRCITLESPHVIAAIPGVNFWDVAVASAGAVFVATSQGLREYDSRGRMVSRPLTEGRVVSVDVFSDGRVAAGLEDGSVAVLSCDEAQSSREWRVTATFKSKVWPWCLAVAQDDSCLSVADGCGGRGRVLCVYSCSGQLLLEKDLGYSIQSLASSTAAVVVSSCGKRGPPLKGCRVEAYSYSGQLLWQRTSSNTARDLCPDPGSIWVYITVSGMRGVRVLRGEGQQGTQEEIVSGSEALQEPTGMSMDRQATCLAVISGYCSPRTVTVFTVTGC